MYLTWADIWDMVVSILSTHFGFALQSAFMLLFFILAGFPVTFWQIYSILFAVGSLAARIKQSIS